MRFFERLITRLLILYLALGAFMLLLSIYSDFNLSFGLASIILTASLLISASAGTFFTLALQKTDRKRIIMTQAGIVLKLVLFIALILSLILITHNRSVELILTFFIIYLAFTSLLLYTFVTALKKEGQ